MKQLKHILAPLIICLLLTPLAGAETIGDLLGVTKSVTMEPFETSTKKTLITINAQVDMPQVEELYFYNVAPRIFSDNDIKTIIAGFGFPETANIKKKESGDESSSYKGYSMNSYAVTGNGRTMYIFNEYMNQEPCGASIQVDSKNTTTEYSTAKRILPYYSSYDELGLSQSEARQIADSTALQVAPELTLNASGILSGSLIFYGDEPLEDAPDADVTFAHEFIYSRTINGVPVTVTSTDMGAYNEYMPALLEEGLYIIVTSEGFDNARYYNPYTLTKAEHINPTDLLSFNEVMETAIRMLPLTILPIESEYATADSQEQYTINRISFGYVRVNVENQLGEYQLVPAWDFFGSRVRIGRFYENGEHVIHDWEEQYAIDSYLTINAITGEIIDRSLGY